MSFSNEELKIKYKNMGLPDFPQDWKIGVVSKLTNRVKVGFVGTCNKYYCNEKDGVAMIRTTDLTNQGVSFENLKYVTREFHEKNIKSQLQKGDILIARHGDNGKACIYNSKQEANCLNIVVIESKDSQIETEYIKYLFDSDIVKNQILFSLVGSVQNVVNTKTIANLIIPYPSDEERKGITSLLSTLDDKIEVNNQINKTLENMAQAIFKQWFVDFEFPNEDGEPYKSSGGEMIESELGMIPKGWEVKPFEDAFYFQEGPGIRNWQYVENGTKFINIRCIRDNDLYLETANMISFEEAEGKYKHFMIDSGDIVMSTSGTLGRYAIVREEHLPLCLNTSVIRFKPLHGQEHYSYMYAYLTSNEFLNHLTTKASGSVQKNFGPMHLRQIKLLYPNVSIIKLLNAIISPIIKSSLHTKKENDKLKKLRDTLLPKLMSGEIRVPLDSEGDVS